MIREWDAAGPMRHMGPKGSFWGDWCRQRENKTNFQKPESWGPGSQLTPLLRLLLVVLAECCAYNNSSFFPSAGPCLSPTGSVSCSVLFLLCFPDFACWPLLVGFLFSRGLGMIGAPALPFVRNTGTSQILQAANCTPPCCISEQADFDPLPRASSQHVRLWLCAHRADERMTVRREHEWGTQACSLPMPSVYTILIIWERLVCSKEGCEKKSTDIQAAILLSIFIYIFKWYEQGLLWK